MVHGLIVIISLLYGRQKPQVTDLVCRIEATSRRMTTKLESNQWLLLYAQSAHYITYSYKSVRSCFSCSYVQWYMYIYCFWKKFQENWLWINIFQILQWPCIFFKRHGLIARNHVKKTKQNKTKNKKQNKGTKALSQQFWNELIHNSN